MAYYGNLALRPERKPQETPQPARQRETVVRRRQIPIGEKLLYMFTVAVCAVVAGIIIYRYAEIYQINRQIQDMNRTYQQTTSQTKELQREVEKLSDPDYLTKKAIEMGMVQIDPSRSIKVGDDAVAMNTAKK
ncbi:cell division protein FtsL [Cohnella candidum]|uniref:Cell division protein FtsL n=1 Tax=Cohnella candidum TaxID=2674991 RepID=A0A3G3JVB4_9BACL|nr:septum formation initiator family protein [Cohnella candidum]AYQ71797.1 cell division initiation protein [Cohnella candidum]